MIRLLSPSTYKTTRKISKTVRMGMRVGEKECVRVYVCLRQGTGEGRERRRVRDKAEQ